jgi:F-type H+-transporting ATPase subunit delta
MATISNNDIARAIYLSTKDKQAPEQANLFPKIIQFLYRKRLLSQAQNILSRLDEMIDNEEGRIVVTISSKEPLHENLKKEIAHILKEKYSAQKILLVENLNENLLGGFKIEVNNEIIDLTIKNKINQLQKYLTKTV